MVDGGDSGGSAQCYDDGGGTMIYTAHDRNISAETMTFKILVCFQKEVIIKIDNWHLITNS